MEGAVYQFQFRTFHMQGASGVVGIVAVKEAVLHHHITFIEEDASAFALSGIDCVIVDNVAVAEVQG